MIYVVEAGKTRKEYDTAEGYMAVKAFMTETGTALEDISVRAFGGASVPATTLWPRARVSDSSHEPEVE